MFSSYPNNPMGSYCYIYLKMRKLRLGKVNKLAQNNYKFL